MIMGLTHVESVFLHHQSEKLLKPYRTYNKKWQGEEIRKLWAPDVYAEVI